MTERLYYTQSYLTNFEGQIQETADEGRRAYLDRTAFYPSSGGQPFDRGTLNGVAIVDVVDEGERIAHLLDEPVTTGSAAGVIDWTRRFDHMQQHTGQHLLSAVFAELWQAATVSFHMGAESSTIDLAVGALTGAQIDAVVRRANEIVFENRPVSVVFEHASETEGLRKASERDGELRIVSIDGLDRSACGGTHVRATGEIGPVFIRKLDKVRGNVRVEFLCGARAVRRAQADYEALAKIARVFSSPLDETPALVAAQVEKLQESEKLRRKATAELATLQGRELYDNTVPNARGVRRAVRRIAKGTIDEELRLFAQGFTARPDAVFVALIEEPPTVLLAASKGGAVNAGEVLKPLLAAVGGRGGGSPQMAQGGVPSREALDGVAAALETRG
ncbi:MAG: DHHA1 domain-containing protein [Bryobacteraceae bacterium]